MEMGWIPVLVVPFIGTALGAGAVLGLPVESERVQSRMNGFAAGAMLAALFFNLLLPGTEGGLFWTGAGFGLGLWLLAAVEEWNGRVATGMVLMAAVVLHNIPEGMAAGLAGTERPGTIIGIALQNVPDGAVVAVPLAAMGMKKGKAFLLGVLSGAVEPVAALGANAACGGCAGLEPGMMGFAAGAMVYVIIRELLPRMGQGKTGAMWFSAGFLLLMVMGGIT